MSLTTDHLRRALADAADAPYDAAGAARLQGVRTRVRRARQRRTAAASGVAALAVAGVVGSVALGGPGTTAPAPASTTSGQPTRAAGAQVELPSTWGPREVVGAVTGSGTDTPGRLLTWPSQVTGLLTRCDGRDVGVVVTIQRGSGEPTSSTAPCVGDADVPFQVVALPAKAASIRAGEQVRLQVRLDPPTTSPVTFGAALLVGRDEIDMSALRNAPQGWSFVGAYALAEGWQYTAYASGDHMLDQAITNGVRIALADQRQARLEVRCWNGLRLEVDPGSSGEPTSVTCPAGRRSSQTVELDLRPGQEQRLSLHAVDAEPGALVEVGVSTR